MEIKVLGTGCPNCTALYKTIEKALSELALEGTLLKEQDILKIIEYKVMGLPALVIDGNVISAGKVLSLTEVKQILTQKREV